MSDDIRLDLSVVEQRVCDITSDQLGIPRNEVRPTSRLIEDLHCDSLDMVELIMELEDEFLVTIPNDPLNPVGKSVFTRQPFRLSDLAEVVYLQQGSGKPERKGWWRQVVPDSCGSTTTFSQLGGRCAAEDLEQMDSLFEPLGAGNGVQQFRRRSDGMRCVLLPAAVAKIGGDGPDSLPDERPVHTVQLDSFLIGTEQTRIRFGRTGRSGANTARVKVFCPPKLSGNMRPRMLSLKRLRLRPRTHSLFTVNMNEGLATTQAPCRWHPFTHRWAFLHLAYTTWLATSGNGVGIGITRIFTDPRKQRQEML